jgi:hypothetical protein
MSDRHPHPLPSVVAFQGTRVVAAGRLDDVARAVRQLDEDGAPALVLEAGTGRPIDLDLRGTPDEVAARVIATAARHDPKPGSPSETTTSTAEGPHAVGRPRLGVVAREVTLLPRHWEWLATQSGGASAALRRLVDLARRESAAPQRRREAEEATYRAMHALAGDLPGFEEASRALFAHDREAFTQRIAGWPADVAGFLERLLEGADEAMSTASLSS